MRAYLIGATAVGLAAAMTAVVLGQAKPAASIQGAWKLTEVVTTGANAATNASPQPSLYIFTGSHYSVVSVDSQQPRVNVQPAKVPGKLTDAEKLSRYEIWAPFTAQSGTY
jgi:hypothetical protein